MFYVENKTNMFVTVVACCVFLIGVAITWLIYSMKNRFLHNSHEICSEEQLKLVNVSDNHLEKLLFLIEKTEHYLKKYSSNFWACFGTVLAAQRHGHLTPWDDDADYCTEDFDAKTLLKLQKELEKENLQLKKVIYHVFGVYQLHFSANHPMLKTHPSKTLPFVDWITVKKYGKSFRYASLLTRSMFDGETYPCSLVEQKTKLPLRALKNSTKTIEITVPHDSISITNRHYGTPENPTKWKTEYLASSHQNMKLFVSPCRLKREQAIFCELPS